MSSDRRFSEREIREVFERAAAEQERAVHRSADDGLTLAEMQEVAASAGIAPEFVATAARAVALGEPESGRESFGPVPIGVHRTEYLPGPPTDALWEGLVADLRHTFAARGTVETVGRLREWRNGNLRVMLEPSGDGSRLRFRTRREGASAAVGMGVAAAVLGAVLLALGGPSLAAADLGAFLAALLLLAGGGAGSVGTWVRQRAWAETRERQMEAVAERAAEMAGQSLAPPASPGRGAPESRPELALGVLGLDPLAEPDRQRAVSRRRTR